MGNITDTARWKWRYSSMLLKIIYINVAVFLMLRIVSLICHFFNLPGNVFLRYLELPSSIRMLALRPWTAITYMFSQFGLLHILFNMLWLYWFGTIFLLTDTQKRLVALYLYGGLGGAAMFVLCYNLLPLFAGHSGLLIGSSAAVIAIVIAATIAHPDYKIQLLFLGSVSLKWVAIVTIAIFVLSLSGGNAGGQLAHLGGAAMGLWYGIALRRGKDITKPLNSLIDWIVNLFRRLGSPSSWRISFKPRRSKAASSKKKSPKAADDDQEMLDRILEKIKKSGYSALSAEEKKRLFDVSKRIK